MLVDTLYIVSMEMGPQREPTCQFSLNLLMDLAKLHSKFLKGIMFNTHMHAHVHTHTHTHTHTQCHSYTVIVYIGTSTVLRWCIKVATMNLRTLSENSVSITINKTIFTVTNLFCFFSFRLCSWRMLGLQPISQT